MTIGALASRPAIVASRMSDNSALTVCRGRTRTGHRNTGAIANNVPTLLVTGHSGFVGRVLFEGFGERAPPTRPEAPLERPDIRSPTLAAALAHTAPDAVLHLAALTSVAESLQDPDGCFDVSFRGRLNLMRARFRDRMLHVGSGDCHGALPEPSPPLKVLKSQARSTAPHRTRYGLASLYAYAPKLLDAREAARP